MVIFTCSDNFEAMMTCIYDAWAARLGHSNIRLQTEPVGNLELFCEYRHIDTAVSYTHLLPWLPGVPQRTQYSPWEAQVSCLPFS